MGGGRIGRMGAGASHQRQQRPYKQPPWRLGRRRHHIHHHHHRCPATPSHPPSPAATSMTATLFEVAVLHLAWRMLGDGDETRRQELRYAYCSAVAGWLLLARRREARIVAADVRRWGLAMAAARRLDEPAFCRATQPARRTAQDLSAAASFHGAGPVVGPLALERFFATAAADRMRRKPMQCHPIRTRHQFHASSKLQRRNVMPMPSTRDEHESGARSLLVRTDPLPWPAKSPSANSTRTAPSRSRLASQPPGPGVLVKQACCGVAAWGLGPCTPEQVAGTPLERALEHQTQGQACSSGRYGLQQEAGGGSTGGSWQLTIDAAIPSPTPSIPPLHGATPNQQPTSPTDLINQHRCVLRMPRSRQCHDPCAVPACRLASSRPWSDPKSTDDDGAPLRWETDRRRFDAKNDAIRPFNTNTAPPSQFSGGQLPAT
ncbi:hypothetical protein Purlil1_10153 [Purpureocillium lilacinum]|uniref:Uncharacterized protein n=1 Tax=Purpureocillium lilacinum TaxID=33203 RepID=A0ABR0BN61_PURLI|nr:hypothetical protein Purlil1_10153 [Purpureocillium lilacinum]